MKCLLAFTDILGAFSTLFLDLSDMSLRSKVSVRMGMPAVEICLR